MFRFRVCDLCGMWLLILVFILWVLCWFCMLSWVLLSCVSGLCSWLIFSVSVMGLLLLVFGRGRV